MKRLTCDTDPERGNDRLCRDLVDEAGEEAKNGDDSSFVVGMIREQPSESVKHLGERKKKVSTESSGSEERQKARKRRTWQ